MKNINLWLGVIFAIIIILVDIITSNLYSILIPIIMLLVLILDTLERIYEQLKKTSKLD